MKWIASISMLFLIACNDPKASQNTKAPNNKTTLLDRLIYENKIENAILLFDSFNTKEEVFYNTFIRDSFYRLALEQEWLLVCYMSYLNRCEALFLIFPNKKDHNATWIHWHIDPKTLKLKDTATTTILTKKEKNKIFDIVNQEKCQTPNFNYQYECLVDGFEFILFYDKERFYIISGYHENKIRDKEFYTLLNKACERNH